MAFLTKEESDKKLADAKAKAGFKVVAVKKGFFEKVREVGEKFVVPADKDGKLPKSSWYKSTETPKAQVEQKQAPQGKTLLGTEGKDLV